jgi:cell division protein FtsB
MRANPSPPRTEPPKVGLIRQLLATPWVAIGFMASCLFLVAMMTFAIWGERGFLAMWQRQNDLETLRRDINDIEQVNTTLNHEIQRLHSDLGYIEKIAREELGLVRPKEIVFEFAE